VPGMDPASPVENLSGGGIRGSSRRRLKEASWLPSWNYVVRNPQPGSGRLHGRKRRKDGHSGRSFKGYLLGGERKYDVSSNSLRHVKGGRGAFLLGGKAE